MGRAARVRCERLVTDTDRLYAGIAMQRGWWPRTALKEA
jgi:hypothetical protein